MLQPLCQTSLPFSVVLTTSPSEWSLSFPIISCPASLQAALIRYNNLHLCVDSQVAWLEIGSHSPLSTVLGLGRADVVQERHGMEESESLHGEKNSGNSILVSRGVRGGPCVLSGTHASLKISHWNRCELMGRQLMIKSAPHWYVSQMNS